MATSVGGALITEHYEMHINYLRQPALALACGLLAASTASAMEVNGWDVTVSSAFDTERVEFRDGVGPTRVSPVELAWSDAGGNVSSLHVEMVEEGTSARNLAASPAAAAVTAAADASELDAGAPALVFSLTHVNQPVELATVSQLRGGVLVADASLQREEDDTPIEARFEMAFRFLETFNQGAGGMCEDGNAVPDGGCPDIFIANPSEMSESFVRDGTTYRASLSAVGTSFSALSEGECSAVGAEAGCIGFETGEERITDVDFALEVAAVPLPAAALLLPSALLAMGIGFRRRKRAV